MKKFSILFILLLMAAVSHATPLPEEVAADAPRKKVAVVLSGGGAKGAAHARALKVIEEAGLPIDYIVGTSMGALVGGMYASGYNAAQIDSIFHVQNWKVLLTDAQPRLTLDLEQRQRVDNYMLKVRFNKSPYEMVEGGFLKGYNVAKLIAQYTADTPDSINYQHLKIPFACVATDLVTGEEIDMHSGYLAESMRASMSIPGVFTPVRKGGALLVDGGMTNNFPVDIARKLGADYVIGVDVSDGLSSIDELKSAPSILNQLVNKMCANKHDENVANTDIYIKVNTQGYSAASFNKAAIDTLLVRGETAARNKWSDLVALRLSLGLMDPLPAPAPRALPQNMEDVAPPSTIYKVHDNRNFLGVGARFDNEELASILIGGYYEFRTKSRLSIGLEGRLGRRINATLYGTAYLSKKWKTSLAYNVHYDELRLYSGGQRLSSATFSSHIFRWDISHNWRNIRVRAGLEYDKYIYNDPMVHPDFEKWKMENSSEGYLNYVFGLDYDDRDAITNAKRGMQWNVGYRFVTTNLYNFNGGSGLHIINGHWKMIVPCSPSTYFTPFVYGRWVSTKCQNFSLENFVGGINTEGRYMPQQIPFAGINYVEAAPFTLLIGGFSLRQHLTPNNYLFGIANYGYAKNEGVLSFNEPTTHMAGCALGYGYNSPVGPIEFSFNWSNVTHKLGVFLNLGFMF